MPSDKFTASEIRRRRTALRSLGIASAAAFAGGVAVVGVQYGLGLVSAGYPPIVQGLACAAESGRGEAAVTLAADGSGPLPVAEFAQGSLVACRVDALGADYATWSVLGPQSASRSGPLDTLLPCQSPGDFAAQDPSQLQLSACQRFLARETGTYLLTVSVMQRGHGTMDRARLLIRILPRPDAGPAAPLRQSERLSITLRLAATEAEQEREADLSAAFSEHGLMPQSRAFERTVYRLSPEETFVSAAFRVRSASNASSVQLAYVPSSRSVVARFTLRSGSLLDRWRGWVSGTVIVRVREQHPASDVALPDLDLHVPGRAEVPLPADLDPARMRIVMRRPTTGTEAEILPGESAMLDRARISARLSEGRLLLEAAAE